MSEQPEISYAKVRIDTDPDKDGWCFCTPFNHPNDIEKGLTDEEFSEKDQIFAQTINGFETAIQIIEKRLPLYKEIGQINALKECISSIRTAMEK